MFPAKFPFSAVFTDVALLTAYAMAFVVLALIAIFIISVLMYAILDIYKTKPLFWRVFSAAFYAGFAVAMSQAFAAHLYVQIALGVGISYYFLQKHAPGSAAGMAVAVIGILVYILSSGTLDVFAVYLFVLLLLYITKHHFQPMGIMLAKRAQWGIASMDTIAKHKKLLNALAWVSIILGYIGMVAMAVYLLYNLYTVYFHNAIPGISPVLPGVKVPGSPIVLPLWHGILSIFVVALIHEFAHGVFARLYKMRVKHTGFAMLGPFLGAAFVDIDEKKLTRAKPFQQLAVLSAGPFSNIVLGLVVLLISTLLVGPFLTGIVQPGGVQLSVVENSPAAIGGLESGMVLTGIDDVPVLSADDVLMYLNASKPSDAIIATVIREPDRYEDPANQHPEKLRIVLGEHPDNASMPYLGVTMSGYGVFTAEGKERYGPFVIESMVILSTFLFWLFLISIGIGIANLLPIGPVDGGRMLLTTLGMFMPEVKAKIWWQRLSTLFLFVIVLILFSPMFL